MVRKAPPKFVAIDNDEFHAEYVGRLKDGRQVFITTPFIPATGRRRARAFVAVYLFDSTGRLAEARIKDLGTRTEIGQAQRQIELFVSQLGGIVPGRIVVRPFQIRRFGTSFGLIPRPPESKDDSWWVEAQPGNFMAFHEPWDSGEYDT